MSFDLNTYTEKISFGLYDGTNSADILSYPWATTVSLVSEADGVLTLYSQWYGDNLVFQTGDYLLVTPDGGLGRAVPAAEESQDWIQIAAV